MLDVPIRKAKIDLHLAQRAFGCQIAVDGVSIPCYSIHIDIKVGKNPIFTLVRHGKFINNEFIVTEETIANPIIEQIEADPLIMHDKFFK